MPNQFQLSNPYGAVPEALKETRLSLHDLMSDYLATKTQEAKLKLDEAKARTENIAAGVEGRRLELTNLKDIATRQASAEEFEQTHKLAEKTAGIQEQYGLGTLSRLDEQLEETKAQNIRASKLAERQVAIKEREARNEERLNAPIKTVDALKEMGFPSSFAGANPNALTTRNKAMEDYGGLVVPYTMQGMQGNMEKLISTIDVTKDPAQRKTLLGQYHEQLKDFQMFDNFTKGKLSEKDRFNFYSDQVKAGATDLTWPKWNEKFQTRQDQTRNKIKELEGQYDRMNEPQYEPGEGEAKITELNAKLLSLGLPKERLNSIGDSAVTIKSVPGKIKFLQKIYDFEAQEQKTGETKTKWKTHSGFFTKD